MNVIIQLSTYDGNKIQQGEDNMARPTRCRRICMEPAYDSFFPDGFLTGDIRWIRNDTSDRSWRIYTAWMCKTDEYFQDNHSRDL